MWGDDGRVCFAIYSLHERTFNARKGAMKKNIYNEKRIEMFSLISCDCCD